MTWANLSKVHGYLSIPYPSKIGQLTEVGMRNTFGTL